MQLTAEVDRYWLMYLAGVMTKRFSNSRSYLNPLASDGSVLIDGVLTRDIYQHKCMKWVKRKTQKIERKHLRLRTRIKRITRRTICFSKSEVMHDLVIELFTNRYEFGLAI